MKKAESQRALRKTYHPAIITNADASQPQQQKSFFDKRMISSSHRVVGGGKYHNPSSDYQSSREPLKGPRGNILKRDIIFLENQPKRKRSGQSRQQSSNETSSDSVQPAINFWKNQQFQRELKIRSSSEKIIKEKITSLVKTRDHIIASQQSNRKIQSLAGITKTANLGIIKTTDTAKQKEDATSKTKNVKQSPMRGYSKPIMGFANPNLRRRNSDVGDMQIQAVQDYQFNTPQMGIEGRKVKMSSYLPQFLLSPSQVIIPQPQQFESLQAQQGVQKDSKDEHPSTKQYLSRVAPQKIDQSENTPNAADEKSYFVFSGTRVQTSQQKKKPIPAPPTYKDQENQCKFEQFIKDAVYDNDAEIIIDSNVEHSKSLEKFVNILESARQREERYAKQAKKQPTLNQMRYMQKPIIIKQLLKPALAKRNYSPINEDALSLTSTDNIQEIDDPSSSPYKKQKFIVKITTPTPTVLKLNSSQQSSSQLNPKALQWPLQFSDLNVGGRKVKYHQQQQLAAPRNDDELVTVQEQLRQEIEASPIKENVYKQRPAQKSKYEPWFGEESDRSIQMMKSDENY